MDEPKRLDTVFEKKLLRVPDYQRGYAWQPEQLKDFWEDLVNLPDYRSHYTGVLTLKEIPVADIKASDKEFWLVEDHSYKLFHVVDGQQRLTTFVVFLQAFVEFTKALPENQGRADANIYISDSLNIADVRDGFLYRTKPRGDRFRTYKFGYTTDNPSHDYLRYRILGERGGGSVQETFYTLNLANALRYFSEQLDELYLQEGQDGLEEIYKKLTRRFLFNEYIIKDEFDVFVAFETMNNRGKQLSALELLKNRLIYLTTLYEDHELDVADRTSLRDAINDAWKEVYHQLGRNKAEPLNDDEFLQAHSIMYFGYSQRTNYVDFLLNRQFAPRKVHEKIEREVALEIPRERSAETDTEEPDAEYEDPAEETRVVSTARLRPTEIRDFVNSLNESVVHWFDSCYPQMSDRMSDDEQQWVMRLNRLGIAYFRPLVMAVLKNEQDEAERIRVFRHIERFIFLAFRMTSVQSNYRRNVYFNVSRSLDRRETSLSEIAHRLDSDLAYAFNEDGFFRTNDFYNFLEKRFRSESGYYWWSGLRYLLYEYELSLLAESRQKKVDWDDLLKPGRDRISIEHIYPQTETPEWAEAFRAIEGERRKNYNGSLGNMLLLSASINSSLQNDAFSDKKSAKYDGQGIKLRNGYSDGSHSEIEVSRLNEWGPDQVRQRGLKLLRFAEDHWDFRMQDDEREKLLFLESEEEGV